MLILKYMVRKLVLKPSKNTLISQILIAMTAVILLVAAYESVTQNDFTTLAPTQLFIAAGVLGILGIYLKDEK